LLAQHDEAELVAVADVDAGARDAAAQAHGVAAVADYREVLGRVDAVTVVVPTKAHREVAGFFLENGVDVLVEKPITRSLAEAEQLVELAERHGRVLQVGHVERYNAVMRAIKEQGFRPRYVESERVAPFSFRSTDIGVVLDLMIHDIDLVLSLMQAPLVAVEAYGGAVFTPAEDLASATLKFEGGGVAHLTASRVALKAARRMRLFSRDGYASLDFQKAHGIVIKKNPGWELEKLDLGRIEPGQDLFKLVFEGLLSVNEYQLDSGNPLRDELSDFLASVRTRTPPQVSGRDGCAAVAAAERVLAEIAKNRW
jgi:predicted dehydrogenase